ncbi:hypothetical protein QTP70_013029 [Hemibagrus guttatus]|uniref:Uncharacterized protein n=1 Tax=Hemibagrus guttatus TaxID=175788 RepID=A0AAE0UTP6_9TELE|nr:hypothetical protein QTP70_013029 [Hemibagrus guttatus]
MRMGSLLSLVPLKCVSEPRSARPDRKKPWSTEKSSVGSGAVLERPALTEAGTGVQGNRMETPDTTPVQGDGGDVDMVDEPVFKVPNKRKKQGKGRGKKQAKKETKVEEGESDSDDRISDSVLTFDSQEEQINVVYSTEDIKEFLRNTKWQKNVALEEFFPDRKQFIHDVKFFRREGAFIHVEIFHLKKLITRGANTGHQQPSCASLWHKLACVDLPPNLLASIQALLVDFWDGLHWIPQSILHLPKEEGGQGLVQLASRTAAFRLQFLQRLLTGPKDLIWRPVDFYTRSEDWG